MLETVTSKHVENAQDVELEKAESMLMGSWIKAIPNDMYKSD